MVRKRAQGSAVSYFLFTVAQHTLIQTLPLVFSRMCHYLHLLKKAGFSLKTKPHERMGRKQGPHLFSRWLERDAFEVIWNKYGCLKFAVLITQEARPFALLLIRFLGTAWDLMTCS